MGDGDDALFLNDGVHDHHTDGSALRIIGVERVNAGAGNDIVNFTDSNISYGDIVINGGDGDDYLWSSDVMIRLTATPERCLSLAVLVMIRWRCGRGYYCWQPAMMRFMAVQ